MTRTVNCSRKLDARLARFLIARAKALFRLIWIVLRTCGNAAGREAMIAIARETLNDLQTFTSRVPLPPALQRSCVHWVKVYEALVAISPEELHRIFRDC